MKQKAMAGLWKPLKWQSCRSYVIAFSSRRKPRVPFKWKHERRGGLFLLALMYFRQMGCWASLNRTCTNLQNILKLNHQLFIVFGSLSVTSTYIAKFPCWKFYLYICHAFDLLCLNNKIYIYICQEWPDHSKFCYDVVLVNVQECSLFFKGTRNKWFHQFWTSAPK